jgi:hypothetical protein
MTTWPAPGCAFRYWRAVPVTDETVAFTPPGLQSGAAAAVGAAMMPHADAGVDWRRQLGGIRSVMDQSRRHRRLRFHPSAAIDCLGSGGEARMTLPDPADPTAQQFRVVA